MMNPLCFLLVALSIVLFTSISTKYTLYYMKEKFVPTSPASILVHVTSKVTPESKSIIRLPSFNITVVPTLKNGKNLASNQRTCPDMTSTLEDQFIIVTNCVYIKHKKYAGNYEKTDAMTLELRWLEMMSTLQANLNHPSVKKLVVFVEHQEAVELLQKYDFKRSDKLVLYYMGKEVEMPHLIDYATKCFKDEVIAITNFDIKFANGWQELNYQHLKRQKLMYCLTRHASTSKCKVTIGHGVCDEGYPYLGSHDTYMFHVKEHLSYERFPELHKKMFNANGMENVMIWTFQHSLGFKVTNPCKVLFVHHEHCVSSIRNSKVRPRINGKHSGWVPFTITLE